MSAVPAPQASDVCPLCGIPAGPEEVRCAACGYDLAGVGERPGPVSRSVVIWSLIGLAVVYLITLGIVGLTH